MSNTSPGRPQPFAPDKLPTWTSAAICWLLGTGAILFMTATLCADELAARQLVSAGLWRRFVTFLGGTITPSATGLAVVELSLGWMTGVVALTSLALWIFAGWLRYRRGDRSLGAGMRNAGGAWLAWLALLLWLALWTFGISPGLQRLTLILLPFVLGLSAAVWLTRILLDATRGPSIDPPASTSPPLALIAAMLIFVGVFTWMNWQLYWSLRLPHGDSAMYEEHLWNLTHGKGFRSYLDQGLFLGEHLQVIHLLLLPLHWLWPSQLLLELCESIALALVAVPVYQIALRHSGRRHAALSLAVAVLFYFPLHFLEISIDLKTFRPIGLGIAPLLFAIDRIETKRFRSAAALLLLALSAQEDYSLVLAPLGIWTLLHFARRDRDSAGVWFGAGLFVFSTAYFLLAVLVVIPAFRAGADVHYAQYFGELGNTPGDLARRMLSDPGAILSQWFSVRTLFYLLAMLAPLGGLSLLSPGRLFVAAPLAGILALMQLSADEGGAQILIPFHHFHAPLVPFVLWSAAAGLGGRTAERGTSPALGRLALASAVFVGVWFTNSPAGIGCWDRDSPGYWRTRYVPDDRAALFPLVFVQIPRNARVASTDFVHPRFTHHERSYDYSQYPRRVANYERRVPDDTDYIVIDTRHPYSWIHSPDDVPELREQPERWELLPDETRGYFIVLKRRQTTP